MVEGEFNREAMQWQPSLHIMSESDLTWACIHQHHAFNQVSSMLDDFNWSHVMWNQRGSAGHSTLLITLKHTVRMHKHVNDMYMCDWGNPQSYVKCNLPLSVPHTGPRTSYPTVYNVVWDVQVMMCGYLPDALKPGPGWDFPPGVGCCGVTLHVCLCLQAL